MGRANPPGEPFRPAQGPEPVAGLQLVGDDSPYLRRAPFNLERLSRADQSSTWILVIAPGLAAQAARASPACAKGTVRVMVSATG